MNEGRNDLGMEDEKAVGGYNEKDASYEISKIEREELNRISSLSSTGQYEANKLLADVQTNFKKIVALSHYYTDKIGILKSALKTYITLTIGDIRFDGGTKKNTKFLEDFVEEVKMNKVLRQSIPDLFKAGNFFWFRETSGKKTEWVHQLNPIDVEVAGHNRDRPVAKLRCNNDPQTMPEGLNKGKDGLYDLPLNKTYHCAIDREGYLKYGKPVTTPAFEPIQHMQRLIDMETDSIESVIESLIIITIGDEKRPATKDQVEDLTGKVKKLKSTSRLVGNHTLKADIHEKSVEVFNPDKFEVPMKMLMYSLGIVPSIFTGEGSYSTATAGMSTVKKIIEQARIEIEDTLNDLLKDVAMEAGLNPKNNPKVNLGKLDLTDEKIQHNILRDLYLDGIISAETYALVHGHKLDIEQDKIKAEEKYDIEPRQMSSTLSKDGRPESMDSNPDNNPNLDTKPSNGNEA